MKFESAEALLEELFDDDVVEKAYLADRDGTSKASEDHNARLWFPPVGLGISVVEEPRIAVRILSESRDRAIERAIQAVARRANEEVEVLDVGPIDAHTWLQGVSRPLYAGVSIGGVAGTGTLGAFAVDVTGQIRRPLLLTCWHVFVSPGDELIQPGMLDQGTFQTHRIGVMRRDRGPHAGPGARKARKGSKPSVDVAVVELDGQVDWRAGVPVRGRQPASPPVRSQFLPISSVVTGVQRGLDVMKVGRTTGYTVGRLTGVNMRVGMHLRGQRLELVGQYEFRSTGRSRFSEPGDSGALVVEPNGTAVALVVSGSRRKAPQAPTYGCPIQDALDAVQVSLL